MATDTQTGAVSALWLRYFVRLSGCPSIREAAFQSNLSAPAFTRHIDSLEAALGVRLFVRNRQGVVLTTAGRQLLPYANRTLEGMARFVEHASGLGQGSAGTLSIACYPVHVERFLGSVVQQVLSEHPELTFDFTQMRDDRRRDGGRSLIDELEAGEVELAMGPAHDHRPGISGLKAYVANIVALVADDHPRRHKETVSVADLQHVPILTAPPGYFSRARLESAAHATGTSLSFGAQSSSPLALMVLGNSGVGVPILPDDYPLVGQQPDPYPIVVDEHGGAIATPVYLHWRDEEDSLPMVRAFIRASHHQVELEMRFGRQPQTYFGMHPEWVHRRDREPTRSDSPPQRKD